MADLSSPLEGGGTESVGTEASFLSRIIEQKIREGEMAGKDQLMTKADQENDHDGRKKKKRRRDRG